MKRESFGSRLGFILVSAGCAIGIGNVWRFPYVAGENGGSVFVLFYLLFLLCMGVPVLTMELAVGRASRKSAVNGYKALEKPGSKWHIHGWFCMLGCYLLMMYYTTVSGWMISYFFKFLTGTFHGLDTEAVSGVFGSLLADPMEMGLWMCSRSKFLSKLLKTFDKTFREIFPVFISTKRREKPSAFFDNNFVNNAYFSEAASSSSSHLASSSSKAPISSRMTCLCLWSS